MPSIASIAKRSTTPAVIRGFWASMGLIHASALVSAWGSFFRGDPGSSSFAACLALSLSMAFFVLKVWGIPVLRFRPSRKAWVAAVLLVVLIHTDCLRPGTNEFLSSDYTELVATVAFVGGGIPGIRPMWRRRPPWSSNARPSTAFSALVIQRQGFLPHCWVLAGRLFRLRAPPA